MHRAHGFEQLFFARIFQQVGLGAGAYRLEHRFFGVHRSEHQYLRLGQCQGDFARGGYATFARHVQIHQHHIGAQALRHLDRLHAIGSLSDHFDVGLRREDQCHPAAYQGLVIGNEHADAASAGRGRRRHLMLPPPGSDLRGLCIASSCSRIRPTTGEGSRAVRYPSMAADGVRCLGGRYASLLRDQLNQFIHFEQAHGRTREGK